MRREKWVDDLVKSLVKGHRLMDPSAWAPPNPFLLVPLYADLWLEKILRLKRQAHERKISPSRLADTLMGPACIRKEFRWAIWSAKLLGWGTADIMEVITFYKDILASRAGEDVFNLKSCYWHSKNELRKMIEDKAWTAATPETKTYIGKISANCPPIAWGLHTDFFYHRAYELYGLYRGLEKSNPAFSSRDALMIRQYGPFCVPEVWEHSKNFPINQIIIKCVYKNLTGEFDYINHFTTPDTIPDKLTFYNIEVDGRAVTDGRELKTLNAEIENMAVRQDKYYRRLDLEGQKRLTVISQYYALKEPFAAAGMPWYPEKEVFSRFAGKELLKIHFSKLGGSQKQELFWKEIFDPNTKLTRKEFRNAANQVAGRLES